MIYKLHEFHILHFIMRRSIRIAQKSFAAEAAQHSNPSDKTIQSWPSTIDDSNRERLTPIVKDINDMFDDIRSTFGTSKKAEKASSLFLLIQKNLHLFAYHRRFLETQSLKCEEMMKVCSIHMINPSYSQEEILVFVRLTEICKAHKQFCQRVLAIHHPTQSHANNQQSQIRRYPLRSNRGRNA
jgi:hypothetical protein